MNSQPPKYRHYKPKNLGVVRLNGRDYYLGPYNSPANFERYHRLIASWLATGEVPASREPEAEPVGPTVAELILAFLKHAEGYYRRPDGTPTGEYGNIVEAVKPLKQLFGQVEARTFGPKSLKAVRDAMVAGKLCRNVVNQRIGRIVRVFRWAVENEMVTADVHHGLKAVAGLRKGRTAARETEPVKPVPEADVDAVRGHVSRQVWAMIQLQRLTGMRPGEVEIMRTGDVDRSGKVWSYVPHRHKTEHHERGRAIYLGPQAQAVLQPWLKADPFAYLFSPREADEEVRLEKRRNRKTPLTPSQRSRKRKAKPKRTPGEFYDRRAYAQAVRRACKKAGVAVWGPNRLRHNAATRLRKEFGLDVARAVLGHADAATTTIYAERDAALGWRRWNGRGKRGDTADRRNSKQAAPFRFAVRLPPRLPVVVKSIVYGCVARTCDAS